MVKKEGYTMANEEVKRIVMGLCPIDDECMKVIFKNNNPLAEYVLRIILNRSDLIVEKCEVKYELDDFGSHRVFLDVFARDNEGTTTISALEALSFISKTA